MVEKMVLMQVLLISGVEKDEIMKLELGGYGLMQYYNIAEK